MRILFISGELIAGDLAYRLKLEGCDVKLFIEHTEQKHCLDGLVEKTDDWKNELDWVGKEGLIVFDDVGYGKIQDDLRKDGYRVVGGSEGGDRLEKSRRFAQEILSNLGMQTVPIVDFSTPREAIDYVQNHPGKWVVKQNNHQSALNYVGELEDGRDVLSILETYERNGVRDITLQERIEGIEVSINRYFNGSDWVGPSEITIEHKSLFNDNLGPKTGEMGNLMWYDDANGRLFEETIARLKPYLQKVDFRGDIDINSFISEKGVFPIEVTSRFGCPITHSQSAMHISPWHELLGAVADGKPYDLKHRDGYCIALTMALPPFPYEGTLAKEYLSEGLEIFFKGVLTEEEKRNIHYEAVALMHENGIERYVVSHSIGYTMFVTGFGNDVSDAQREARSLAEKIVIPKIFYRTDIGTSFMSTDRKKLRDLGWI
jgi:phosphoribosylamine--glycine ligase